MLAKFLKPKFDENSFSSFISENMSVVGDIEFAGVLRVEGRVRGNLQSIADDKQEHGIVLEKTGSISSDRLSTDYLVIAGVFDVKEVMVTGFLHIKASATIRNVKFECDRFKVDEGADISGCTFNKICRGIPGTTE